MSMKLCCGHFRSCYQAWLSPVVAEMLQVEVLGPVEQVWAAYSQAVASQHCAAKFLCQVNERAKKEGTAR